MTRGAFPIHDMWSFERGDIVDYVNSGPTQHVRVLRHIIGTEPDLSDLPWTPIDAAEWAHGDRVDGDSVYPFTHAACVRTYSPDGTFRNGYWAVLEDPT